MTEYIDLDTPLELKAAWGRTYKPYTSTLRELLDLNHIPYTAANVRPVVFCKDCRHRDPEDHKCDCGQLERAGCVFPVDDDYFCAYGEES